MIMKKSTRSYATIRRFTAVRRASLPASLTPRSNPACPSLRPPDGYYAEMASPILRHGLRPCCPFGTEFNPDACSGTCSLTNYTAGTAPASPLNNYTGSYMHGGSRPGRLVYHFENGTLTPKPCDTVTEVPGVPCVDEIARPDLLPGLVHCGFEGGQYYHASIHIASGAMSFAAQDIAANSDSPSVDPVFRLLTPGGNQTSGINSFALATLLEQAGLGSRKLNNHDVRFMKTEVLAPILTDPCDVTRYTPKNTAKVPAEQALLFNPVGRAAMRIVCAEKNRINLPTSALDAIALRLADDAPNCLTSAPPGPPSATDVTRPLETCPSGCVRALSALACPPET